MLYILVVCAGSLCMPVEEVGAYTLTRAECEARMMQTRPCDRALAVELVPQSGLPRATRIAALSPKGCHTFGDELDNLFDLHTPLVAVTVEGDQLAQDRGHVVDQNIHIDRAVRRVELVECAVDGAVGARPAVVVSVH